MTHATTDQAPAPRDVRALLWIALGVTSFVILTWAVISGASAEFDRSILLSLRTGDLHDPLGPAWLEEAARDVTALGGTALIVAFTAMVAITALVNRSPRLAGFAVVTIVGAQILSETLKNFIDRPRPDLVPHEVAVYSESLPSGHSMMAAVAYFTLAFVLARETQRRRNRAVLFIGAGLIVALVGVSRVYLGVHWPTDVLAGWCAGLAWAGAAALIYLRFVLRT